MRKCKICKKNPVAEERFDYCKECFESGAVDRLEATMQKSKSLLDSEKFQKKLAKLSPYSKMTVEQRVRESEAFARKNQREEEALMRLPKEERLKAIYWTYIDLAVTFAKMLGSMKEGTGVLTKELKKQLKFELTMALKKANVLPLGK